MLTSRGGRLAALALLLGVLAALVAWYGATAADAALSRFPGEDQIAVGYETWVGTRVQVGGTVVETDPVVVAAEYTAWVGDGYERGVARFTVRGLSHPVAPGEHLQVFGTARPGRTIEASNGVVVPASNYPYMYAVSFLAGCWVLARLIRGWRIDPATLAVERRRRPLSLRHAILGRSDANGEESHDA
jgi:hypothetical protein